MHTHHNELRVILAADVPWAEAYEQVEALVRRELDDPDVKARLHLESQTLSTKELVELLWPESLARGEAITTRKRLYKALMALAPRGLSDCATRGEPVFQARLKKEIRPWLWHSPKEREIPVSLEDRLANVNVGDAIWIGSYEFKRVQ